MTVGGSFLRRIILAQHLPLKEEDSGDLFVVGLPLQGLPTLNHVTDGSVADFLHHGGDGGEARGEAEKARCEGKLWVPL